MDLFGIGPMELILILIVALMVFGPDKLPQIGAKLGRTMRDMRKATRAISYEINSTREAIGVETKELTEPFQEVAGAAKTAGTLVAAAKNPGQAIRDSVLKELNPPPASDKTIMDAPQGENTIAPPEAIQAASSAAPEAPLALPEPARDVVLPAPEQPAADAGTVGEPMQAAASDALPLTSQTPRDEPLAAEPQPSEPAVDATPPSEPLPAEPPAPRKRKPRAKKPPEPPAAAPDAGEQ